VEWRFLGQKRPFLAFLGAGGQFPRPWPRQPKQAGFVGKRFRATFWAGFLRGFGGGLEDAREVPPGARPCRAGLSHPIGPTEGKPARRSTDDYARFFVETVPKRYKFGTGALCKWLDSA
jgi:hypothetical protein